MQPIGRGSGAYAAERPWTIWLSGLLFLVSMTITTLASGQGRSVPQSVAPSDFMRKSVAPSDFTDMSVAPSDFPMMMDVAPSDFFRPQPPVSDPQQGLQDFLPLRSAEEYQGVWRGLDLRGPAPADFVAIHANRAVELYRTANFDEARREIQEAIHKARDQKDTVRSAVAYDFRGLIERMQGRLTDAIDSHSKAVELLEEKGDGAADLLNAKGNLAIACYYYGAYQKALTLLTEIQEVTTDPIIQIRVLNNRGLIYQEIGRLEQAQKDFAFAALAAEGSKDDQLRAECLNNLARLTAVRGKVEEAIQMLGEARRLARGLPRMSKPLEANVLDSWAYVLLEAGRYEPALAKLNEALALEEKAPSPLIKPVIHLNRGRALSGLGRTAEAFEEFQKTERLSQEIGLEALQRQLLSYRGDLHRRLGRLDEAIKDYKSAIDIVRSTRERLTGETEKEFRTTTQRIYRSLVESLIAQEKFEEAFAYLEESKLKVLQDSLRRVHPRLQDLDAQKRIEEARGMLDREEALRQRLLRERAAGAPGEVIEKVESQLKEVKRNFPGVVADLKKRYGNRYASYVGIPTSTFARLKDLLPPGTLLVEFLPTPDFLIFFLVSRDNDLEWRRNDEVKEADLNGAIQQYRALVENVRGVRSSWRIDSWSDPTWKELREATVRLYLALIEPISDRISKAERVIFVPAGILYYLPIHALGKADEEGEIQYLIDQKPVVYLTNSELLSIVTERTTLLEGKSLFALGNPPFEHTEPLLDPLKNAEEEVNAVKRVFGEKAFTLVGQKATRQALLDILRPPAGRVGFEFILLATHAILDPQSPADSWLALDGTNKLTAQEVPNFDLSNVSLVTLSACQTAVESDSPGNELMGLAHFFSQARSPSIVASLWSVDDISTRDLMVTFHKTMLEQKVLDKARALQQAQRALATRPETRHPFFWASFILIGDWR
ncbi:MAG: CHAT domain-containing protein [Syntrophaceae bacterium]|nr:CHAT domain-containing protein [Syntrophaceae bacterium]